MNFCEILKDLRTEKNVTQKEVALACGLTSTCICQLENGSRNPTGSTIRELAKYFDCSADYLLGLKDLGESVLSSPAPELPQDEQQLLALYRKMSHPQKIRVIAYSEGLLSTKTGIRFPNNLA